MKTASVLAFATTALAAAVPVPQAGTSFPLRFGGLPLADDGTKLGFVAANGLEFVLGKPSKTYCPEDSVVDCSQTNNDSTIFSYLNGKGVVNLDTTVPGGQQVYVAAGDEGQQAGQLLFTPAHSVKTSGPALYNGFAIAYDAKLQFEKQDWFACPRKQDDGFLAYDIWAASRFVPGSDDVDCVSFVWKNQYVDSDVKTAWSYE